MKKNSLSAAAFLLFFALSAFGQTTNESVRPFLERAEMFEYQKKYFEAIDEINKAIAVLPNEPRLYLRRSGYQWELKNGGAALEDIKTALTLAPRDIGNLQNVSMRYFNIDLPAEALKTADFIIEIFPANPIGYRNRAVLKQKLEDCEGAAEDFVKADELTPPGVALNADSTLTFIADKLNNSPAAAALYDRLTELLAARAAHADKLLAEYLQTNPQENTQKQRLLERDLSVALNHFLLALSRQKELYAAGNMPDKVTETVDRIALFESQILSLEDCRAFCRELRADYYQNRGKYRQAIAELDRAMSGLTKSTAYRYIKRGDLYLEIKQYEQAVWDYEQAIILDRDLEYKLREKIDWAKQKPEEQKAK